MGRDATRPSTGTAVRCLFVSPPGPAGSRTGSIRQPLWVFRRARWYVCYLARLLTGALTDRRVLDNLTDSSGLVVVDRYDAVWWLLGSEPAEADESAPTNIFHRSKTAEQKVKATDCRTREDKSTVVEPLPYLILYGCSYLISVIQSLKCQVHDVTAPTKTYPRRRIDCPEQQLS